MTKNKRDIPLLGIRNNTKFWECSDIDEWLREVTLTYNKLPYIPEYQLKKNTQISQISKFGKIKKNGKIIKIKKEGIDIISNNKITTIKNKNILIKNHNYNIIFAKWNTNNIKINSKQCYNNARITQIKQNYHLFYKNLLNEKSINKKEKSIITNDQSKQLEYTT